jgi:hypothetical protein
MTYSKLDKYEDTYREDLLLQYLNNQHEVYRLSDFLDVNETDDDDFFNI